MHDESNGLVTLSAPVTWESEVEGTPLDPEVAAMGTIALTLDALADEPRARVVEWVAPRWAPVARGTRG